MTAYTFLVTLCFQVINAYVGTVDTSPSYVPMKFSSDIEIEAGTAVSFLGKTCGTVSTVEDQTLILELQSPCKRMVGAKTFGYLAFHGGEESATVIELSNPDFSNPLSGQTAIKGYSSIQEYWNS